MDFAQYGSKVTISYIGTLDNGRIFHSTETSGPQSYVLGENQLFPALEAAIVGMKVGSSKNIQLRAVDAYGPRREENILTLSRKLFPAGKDLVAGQKMSVEFSGGESRVMMVVDLTDEVVTLDGNHPLAGCDLTFALRLEEVE